MGAESVDIRNSTASNSPFALTCRVPLIAWFASRLIGCIGLVVWPTSSGRWFNTFGLTYMDGGWYRIIVTSGFPDGPLPDHATSWPFFPLYPWIADMFVRLGAPVGPSLIAISWLFSLVAILGVWQLASEHFGREVAVASVWVFALLPGAVGQVLSYSDSLFAAGLVWTLVSIDRILARVRAGLDVPTSRFVAVGLCALASVASRPNGGLILVVLGFVVWRHAGLRRTLPLLVAPSVIFLTAWMIYCHSKTGDALVFLTAKDAWLERTIVDFVRHPHERPANLLHVAVFVVAATLARKAITRVPAHWSITCLVFLGPSMILGIEGLARYVTITVPVSIMVGFTISQWGAPRRNSFLGVSAAAMLFLAVNVVRSAWVP
ncbi:MAG: glycosyltransferase family 39 protein [Ilumatobacteraceae bacterium]|jgi:hypothetical protein|nr:glycosyltransferase family 39 protein [Ilumatobacteraceae bacterium]